MSPYSIQDKFSGYDAAWEQLNNGPGDSFVAFSPSLSDLDGIVDKKAFYKGFNAAKRDAVGNRPKFDSI
jgi:hypothetical protein